MKKYTLVITCQGYENKAYAEGGFAWVPKFGYVFHVKISMEDWMYNDLGVRSAIERVVATKCNNAERFEIVDIELDMNDPEDITAEFEAAYELEQKPFIEHEDRGQDYI